MKKLEAKWINESKISDLKDMSQKNKELLGRTLNVFLDFMEILLRRKVKEQIKGMQ